MVLALKELSIRGDIRTTVEYISVLMATEDYVKVSQSYFLYINLYVCVNIYVYVCMYLLNLMCI